MRYFDLTLAIWVFIVGSVSWFMPMVSTEDAIAWSIFCWWPSIALFIGFFRNFRGERRHFSEEVGAILWPVFLVLMAMLIPMLLVNDFWRERTGRSLF